MNLQESTIAEAKRLLKHAPVTAPCFERSQMEYILARFNGTAGPPFPQGDEPDHNDARALTQRLKELNRDVSRRLQKGAAA